MLLALVAAVLFTVQSLCLKLLPEPRSARGPIGVIAAYSAMIAAGLMLWRVFSGASSIGATTWAYGAAYGVVFVLTMFFYARAMSMGPLSYSSFYFSASLMVPVVASLTLWGEPAGPFKLAGLALFLLSFYFIQVLGARPQAARAKTDIRWLACCLLAFLFNGLLPVVAKLHQIAMNGQEAPELMLVGFSSAGVCALAVWVALGRRRNEAAQRRPEAALGAPIRRMSWSAIGLIVCIGAATGIGNALVAYLTSRLPGALLFPFVNGTMIVLLTLASAWLFREKLSRGGLLGIGTGLLAMIAVNM